MVFSKTAENQARVSWEALEGFFALHSEFVKYLGNGDGYEGAKLSDIVGRISDGVANELATNRLDGEGKEQWLGTGACCAHYSQNTMKNGLKPGV